MKFKKIKKVNYWIISFVLIFFLLIIFLNIYARKVNPKLIVIATDYMYKSIYNQITEVSGTVTNQNIEDIIKIHQNNNGDILYASYNMSKCYDLLKNISSKLNDSLMLKEIVLKEPLFISSNYALFSNLGPQITIKINYLNMTLSNIYSKITEYGLNNALVELYITISVKGRIYTPVKEKDIEVKYDMLISSSIIAGRVPSFYNGMIKTSNILDIHIPI